jgi:hypothetical protein
LLDRVAGIDKFDEPDSLYDAAPIDVKTWNYSLSEHE